MRRIGLILLAPVIFGVGVTAHADPPRTATLRITATGEAMEFRTFGLSTTAFTLQPGQTRSFRKLPPGRYVVVQAPPIGVQTQVGPDEWLVDGQVVIQCSDGSSVQHDLKVGDSVTCVFATVP